MAISLAQLRRFAVARSLFAPVTLRRALRQMGFVQADPICAPARAQDLILRHRVKNYRAGDLDRLYPKLGVEEDYFIVYGFVTRAIQKLMHPRAEAGVAVELRDPWPAGRQRQTQEILAFVKARGAAHPREVNERFSHGTVTNYWGGTSNATTHLLDSMHYRGLLRVAGREKGIRLYAAHLHGPEPRDAAERHARIDALVDAAVRIYAPLPEAGLRLLVRRLRSAAPQWHGELRGAFERARHRLAHARVEGVDWYWPDGEDVTRQAIPETARLLAPFDPVVWDRDRFELLWGWVYRFEAYTPAAKRKLGYYAMPLLWRDRVIGWGNVSIADGALQAEFGYVDSRPPRDRVFRRELDAELDRMRRFLVLDS